MPVPAKRRDIDDEPGHPSAAPVGSQDDEPLDVLQ
jgi:hypothetical protein